MGKPDNNTDLENKEWFGLYKAFYYKSSHTVEYGKQIHHINDDELQDFFDIHLELYVQEHNTARVVEEHKNWILPTVDKAHEYEQNENGSGIQFFDNERLARLRELESNTKESSLTEEAAE